MAWMYSQATGEMADPEGEIVATGYSGHLSGKNVPALQAVPDVGPIPQGSYSIGPVFDSETHGPVVMRLTPGPGTNTFGRDGFMIHGDGLQDPGLSSLGCVVIGRPARLLISQSSDKVLQVV